MEPSHLTAHGFGMEDGELVTYQLDGSKGAYRLRSVFSRYPFLYQSNLGWYCFPKPEHFNATRLRAEDIIEDEHFKKLPPNRKDNGKWFGEVDEEYQFEITIADCLYTYDDFGGNQYLCYDKDWNIFLWHTSKKYLPGQKLRFMAFVQAHDIWKSFKITAIFKAKGVERI